jgi:hypothetical protein
VIGLAFMAARLAEERTGMHNAIVMFGCLIVADREWVFADESSYPATCEYYRICDRIARGEKP